MARKTDKPDDLLTTGQAAELIGVHRETVGRWARLGLIEAGRTPGHQYRITRREAERVAAMVRSGATPE